MATEYPRNDAEALDRYWEGVLHGRRLFVPRDLPDELTRAVIERLAERPPRQEIDDAFQRVWQRLSSEAAAPLPPRLAPLPPSSAARPRPIAFPRPPIGGRAFFGNIVTAAAILLLIGFVAGTAPGRALFAELFLPSRPGSSWPVARGDTARTGSADGVDLLRSPALAWTVNAGGQVTAPPIVGDGLVYLATKEVVALDLATGAERWRVPFTANVSPLALDGGTLYAASDHGDLVALDAASGRERWHIAVHAAVSTGPLPADDMVILLTDNGDLVALATNDGHERWRTGAVVAAGTTANLSYGEETLLAAFGDHTVRAFDPGTGRQLWQVEISTPYDETIDAPVIANHLAYVTSKRALGVDPKGELDVYDLATGAMRWSFALPETGGVLSPIALDGETVVIGGSDKTVRALDAKTGAVRWATTLAAPAIQPPAISRDTIYLLGTDRVLRALSLKNGELLWQVKIAGGNLVGGVAVAPDALIGVTGNGAVMKLVAADGSATALPTAP